MSTTTRPKPDKTPPLTHERNPKLDSSSANSHVISGTHPRGLLKALIPVTEGRAYGFDTIRYTPHTQQQLAEAQRQPWRNKAPTSSVEPTRLPCHRFFGKIAHRLLPEGWWHARS